MSYSGVNNKGGRPKVLTHPDPVLSAYGFSITVCDRFWRQVFVPDPPELLCWVWTGVTQRGGYGRIGKGSRSLGMIGVHELSWIIHFGPIPEGLQVCHTCDNPPCIRPDHLWLGTQADNCSDSVVKGRSQKGEKNVNAKLTVQDVLAIRAEYKPRNGGYALAARYGVDYRTIWAIAHRKKWGWL